MTVPLVGHLLLVADIFPVAQSRITPQNLFCWTVECVVKGYTKFRVFISIFSQQLEVTEQMSTIYATAKVCDFKNATKCDLRLEPGE